MAEEKANKFAKKGLVVDVDKAKFVKDTSEGGSTKTSAKKEKAVKEVKAPKAKKEKAEKAEKTVEVRKITLLTKENPKREGSEAHARFELYRKAKTTADFIEAGGTSGDLRYDEKAGHIKLS